jgi:hypothetical protein
MSLEHSPKLYGVEAVENYPLLPSRSREIMLVRENLQESPVAFVWAPSGNGKTGFGREFRQSTPNTQLILAAQLVVEVPIIQPPFDPKMDETKHTTVVDEFAPETQEMYEAIQRYLSNDMRFVFMTHHPKSRYIDWQKQHKRKLEPMIQLINDFPNALWLYLPKWKPQ